MRDQRGRHKYPRNEGQSVEVEVVREERLSENCQDNGGVKREEGDTGMAQKQ